MRTAQSLQCRISTTSWLLRRNITTLSAADGHRRRAGAVGLNGHRSQVSPVFASFATVRIFRQFLQVSPNQAMHGVTTSTASTPRIGRTRSARVPQMPTGTPLSAKIIPSTSAYSCWLNLSTWRSTQTVVTIKKRLRHFALWGGAQGAIMRDVLRKTPNKGGAKQHNRSSGHQKVHETKGDRHGNDPP